MSLRRNTIANYAGRVYASVIGIVVMPLYLEFLGPEAFGLVGFLVLFQAWSQLLDLGLSPTMAREVAVARAEPADLDVIGPLLRSFELIFMAITGVIVLGLASTSNTIAEAWIHSAGIDSDTVAYCVVLMGLIVGIRFVTSLYASGIRGVEDQVWLNVAEGAITSLRVFGALAILMFISTDIRLFFQYHVIIAGLALAVTAARCYNRLGLRPQRLPLRVDTQSLRRVGPFALSVAYTAGIWIVLSQSDRLILSTILPLEEFAYFTLVALIAGGIVVLTGPVNQALLPRMTTLLAAGRRQDMIQIYRSATQLVAVIAFPIALMLSVYAEPVVYAWTGDRTAAAWCAEVLPWFALGNALLAIAAFQSLLQKAFGDMRLQVIGSTVSVLIQVPVIYVAAVHHGAVGAGVAWLGIRLTWFLIWPAIVHARFVPGLHLGWLRRDILPGALVGVALAILLQAGVRLDLAHGRASLAGVLIAIGVGATALMALSSRYVRGLAADLALRFRAAD